MKSMPSDQPPGAGEDEPILGLLYASNIDEARRASAPLLQTSFAARFAKDPRLAQALEVWWERVANPHYDERLEGIALLWRLTSLSAMATHRRMLVARLGGGLQAGIPSLSSLPDPKDRRAAAEAILSAPIEPWIAHYAAEAVVSDPDPKSDARDTMCAVLLRQTADIGRAFELLNEHVSSVIFRQHDPATGRARRVAWILRSFRPPLYEDEYLEAEERFGECFAQFVSKALGALRSADRAAFVDAAREVILTLNTVVRLHGLRLATHADTYNVIGILRRSFESTEWPKELQDPIERLSIRVGEALIVLARQRIADGALRGIYLTLLGHVFASARLRKMIAAHQGIDAELAYWLETGKVRERMESAAAMEETATAMIDIELARALREAFLADYAVENGQSPDAAIRRMSRELRDAARKRGLILRGYPGETVDFSPLEHEADVSAMGHRRVVLKTPIVERRAGTRTIAIVLKAQATAEGGYHGEG